MPSAEERKANFQMHLQNKERLAEIAYQSIVGRVKDTKLAEKHGVDRRDIPKLIEAGHKHAWDLLFLPGTTLDEWEQKLRWYEESLCAKGTVSKAMVVPGRVEAFENPESASQPASGENRLHVARIAETAAKMLDQLIDECPGPPRVAVTWGTLTRQIIGAIKPGRLRERLVAYTTMGIIGIREGVAMQEREALYNAFELACRYGGSCRQIAAPGIVETTPEHWQALKELRGVGDVLEEAKTADIVLTAIGFVNTDRQEMASTSLARQGLLSDAELVQLARDNSAVGEIGCCFFDAQGCPVPLPPGKHRLGLELDDLHAIVARGGKVLAVCGHDERRVQALTGALRAPQPIVTHLITDHLSIEKVRELAPELFDRFP